MPAFTIPRTAYIATQPIVRDFAMAAGDAESIVFKIIAADAFPAVPVDLTGADVTFRVRERGSRHTRFEKSVGSGIVLTTPASGVLTVTLSEDDTARTYPGLFSWQLRVTLAGAPDVVAQGTLILNGLVGAR